MMGMVESKLRDEGLFFPFGAPPSLLLCWNLGGCSPGEVWSCTPGEFSLLLSGSGSPPGSTRGLCDPTCGPSSFPSARPTGLDSADAGCELPGAFCLGGTSVPFRPESSWKDLLAFSSHPVISLLGAKGCRGLEFLSASRSAQLLEEEPLRVHWLLTMVLLSREWLWRRLGLWESLFSSRWPWGPCIWVSCASLRVGECRGLVTHWGSSQGSTISRPCWAMSVTVSSSSQSEGSCTEWAVSSSPCGEISASLVGLGKLEPLLSGAGFFEFCFSLSSEEALSPWQRLGIPGLPLAFIRSAYGLVLKFPDESSLSGPLFNSWTRGSSSKGVGGGAAGGSRGDRFPGAPTSILVCWEDFSNGTISRGVRLAGSGRWPFSGSGSDLGRMLAVSSFSLLAAVEVPSVLWLVGFLVHSSRGAGTGAGVELPGGSGEAKGPGLDSRIGWVGLIFRAGGAKEESSSSDSIIFSSCWISDQIRALTRSSSSWKTSRNWLLENQRHGAQFPREKGLHYQLHCPSTRRTRH